MSWAREDARAQLDELMGAQRDLDLGAKARKKFWERDVCKFHLAGFSPYRVLKETRNYGANGVELWLQHAYCHALGETCLPEEVVVEDYKIDVHLKEQYDALPPAEKDKYGYEKMFHDCLASLVRQCDRRAANLQAGRKVRDEAPGGALSAPELTAQQIAKLKAVDERIAAKNEEAERLGEGGDVEESMRALGEADALRAQKKEIENASLATAEAPRAFAVCPTTGEVIEAAAAADDAWMASHFESADFQGWKRIREALAELGKRRDGRGPARHAAGYENGNGGEAAEAAYRRDDTARRRGGARRRSRSPGGYRPRRDDRRPPSVDRARGYDRRPRDDRLPDRDRGWDRRDRSRDRRDDRRGRDDRGRDDGGWRRRSPRSRSRSRGRDDRGRDDRRSRDDRDRRDHRRDGPDDRRRRDAGRDRDQPVYRFRADDREDGEED